MGCNAKGVYEPLITLQWGFTLTYTIHNDKDIINAIPKEVKEAPPSDFHKKYIEKATQR